MCIRFVFERCIHAAVSHSQQPAARWSVSVSVSVCVRPLADRKFIHAQCRWNLTSETQQYLTSHNDDDDDNDNDDDTVHIETHLPENISILINGL